MADRHTSHRSSTVEENGTYVWRMIAVFAIYVGAQLAIHYALSLPYFSRLLEIYLLRAPNRSGMFAIVDAAIPAILLGFLNGHSSRNLSLRVANIVGLALGCGIVGLFPAYGAVMPNIGLWWLHQDYPGALAFLLLGNGVWVCGIVLLITIAYHRKAPSDRST